MSKLGEALALATVCIEEADREAADIKSDVRMLECLSYEIQIATDESFSELVGGFNVQTTEAIGDTLEEGRRYWWRGRAENSTGPGEWTAPFSFVTAGETTGVNESDLSSSLRVRPNPASTLSGAADAGVFIASRGEHRRSHRPAHQRLCRRRSHEDRCLRASAWTLHALPPDSRTADRFIHRHSAVRGLT